MSMSYVLGTVLALRMSRDPWEDAFYLPGMEDGNTGAVTMESPSPPPRISRSLCHKLTTDTSFKDSSWPPCLSEDCEAPEGRQ